MKRLDQFVILVCETTRGAISKHIERNDRTGHEVFERYESKVDQ